MFESQDSSRHGHVGSCPGNGDTMFSQRASDYRGHYKTSGRVGTKWAVMFLVLLTASWSAAQPKMSRDLHSEHTNSRVNVIIQYAVPPTAVHFGRVAAKGGLLKRDLRGAINGAAFNVPAAPLANLSKDPDVTYISSDRPIHAYVYSNNPDFSNKAVFAQSAWNQYSGSGIGIAVID